MTILYSAFLGGGGDASNPIQLQNVGVTDYVVDPNDALASITFGSSGSVTTSSGGGGFTWLLTGAAADFDVRATVTAGSFSTGTNGSWLNLGSNRTWSVSQTFDGTKECTATFEISRTGQATALDSCTVTLTATVTV